MKKSLFGVSVLLLAVCSNATSPPQEDLKIEPTKKDAWAELRWDGSSEVQPPLASQCSKSADIKEWAPFISKAEQELRKKELAIAGDYAKSKKSESAKYAMSEKATGMPAPMAIAAAPAAGMPAPMSAPAKIADAVEDNSHSPAIVTAGVVDDNEKWVDYLEFKARNTETLKREFAFAQRFKVKVVDKKGRPVADALIKAKGGNKSIGFGWRTNWQGVAWVTLPKVEGVEDKSIYSLDVYADNEKQSLNVSTEKFSSEVITVTFNSTHNNALKLDFALLMDATGSMGDEIAKISSSLSSVLKKVQNLPGNPDLCVSVLAYRDKGDEFFIKGTDFSNNYSQISDVFSSFKANGGGDTPEALDEAVHVAVHHLSWRANAVRSLVVVTDASSHLNQNTPSTTKDMQAAASKGIKIFSVAASGQSKEGEYQLRQMSQYTGGKFVFLTYSDLKSKSSPGTKTEHDVKNYSVSTLDELLIDLLTAEISAK